MSKTQKTNAPNAAMNGNPTVISTFAGCGGSSLGYHWAGYKELLAIDFDKHAVETFKANFDVPVWLKDIAECTAEEIMTTCNIKRGELDVLDGSPPCQGFSTAGKRKVNDSRNDLFKEYVRLIINLQPKVFVMENVSGMIKGKFKGKFNEILKELKDTGYNVKVKLMNAMWYEVPQSRERLIFIGVRPDINKEPVFPKPKDKVITVKEAWKGLPEQTDDRPMPEWLKKAATEMRPGVFGGDHITNAFIKYRGNKGGSFNTKLLSYAKPSCTLVKTEIGFVGLIHPERQRYISVNEAKRICSFPDDFILTGVRRERIARLGNAVMPKMMYHIAKTIKETILDPDLQIEKETE